MDPHHGSGYDADGAEDDRDAVFPHGDSAWFGPGRGRPASDEGGSSHVTNRLGFDSLDLNGGGRWTGGGAYPDYFGGFNEVPPTAPRPIRVPTRPMTQAGAGISPPWSHPHAPPGATIGGAFSPPRPPRHPGVSTDLGGSFPSQGAPTASMNPPARRGRNRTQRGRRSSSDVVDDTVGGRQAVRPLPLSVFSILYKHYFGHRVVHVLGSTLFMQCQCLHLFLILI